MSSGAGVGSGGVGSGGVGSGGVGSGGVGSGGVGSGGEGSGVRARGEVAGSGKASGAHSEAVEEPTATPDQRPVLRIVKGNPTPEEIAAIVTVFSAIGGSAEEEPEQVSAWAAPAAIHRTMLPVGSPNAWVLSGR